MEEPNKKEDDTTCPTVRLASEEKRELWQPWKWSLIIKLLGRRIGMRFPKSRIHKMWALQGPY